MFIFLIGIYFKKYSKNRPEVHQSSLSFTISTKFICVKFYLSCSREKALPKHIRYHPCRTFARPKKRIRSNKSINGCTQGIQGKDIGQQNKENTENVKWEENYGKNYILILSSPFAINQTNLLDIWLKRSIFGLMNISRWKLNN